MPRIAQNIPENETKAQRFRRVAAPRVQNVLSALSILTGCSSKATYEYTQQNVDQMIAMIEKRLTQLKDAYNQNGNGADDGFSFGEETVVSAPDTSTKETDEEKAAEKDQSPVDAAKQQDVPPTDEPAKNPSESAMKEDVQARRQRRG